MHSPLSTWLCACPGVAYQRGPFPVFYKRDARAVRLSTPALWHNGLFKRSCIKRAALNNCTLSELTPVMESLGSARNGLFLKENDYNKMYVHRRRSRHRRNLNRDTPGTAGHDFMLN